MTEGFRSNSERNPSLRCGQFLRRSQKGPFVRRRIRTLRCRYRRRSGSVCWPSPLSAEGIRTLITGSALDSMSLHQWTVDHHVGHILAQLGVHARRDIATTARGFGRPRTFEPN